MFSGHWKESDVNRNNVSLNVHIYMEKIKVKIKNQTKLTTNKNNKPRIHQICNHTGKNSRSIDHCSLSVNSHFWGHRSKSLQTNKKNPWVSLSLKSPSLLLAPLVSWFRNHFVVRERKWDVLTWVCWGSRHLIIEKRDTNVEWGTEMKNCYWMKTRNYWHICKFQSCFSILTTGKKDLLCQLSPHFSNYPQLVSEYTSKRRLLAEIASCSVAWREQSQEQRWSPTDNSQIPTLSTPLCHTCSGPDGPLVSPHPPDFSLCIEFIAHPISLTCTLPFPKSMKSSPSGYENTSLCVTLFLVHDLTFYSSHQNCQQCWQRNNVCIFPELEIKHIIYRSFKHMIGPLGTHDYYIRNSTAPNSVLLLPRNYHSLNHSSYSVFLNKYPHSDVLWSTYWFSITSKAW